MADKPGNPSEGKVDEKLEAEAAEAKAEASVEAAQEQAEATEEAPQQVKKTRAKKAPAKADEDKPKSARKPRAKKPAEPKAEEPKAEEEKPAEEPKPAAEPKPAPARRTRKETPERVVVRAHAKYVRTSARKARLVCDHIRGKDVAEARAILAFTPRGAAKAWSKLLESAVANAEHNHELVADDLKIVAAYADEGPTLKRFRPRAMGRATRIRKRTSHLTIKLTPKG